MRTYPSRVRAPSLVGLLLLVPITMPAVTSDAPLLRLEIVNHAGLHDRIIQKLIEEVDAIWNPYPVRLEWVQRVEEPEGGARSLRVILDEDVAPADAWRLGAREWLAFITFTRPGGPMNVIHVSPARTRAILHTRRLGEKRLSELPTRLTDTLLGKALGRVVAHEIGHYLLGTSEHSRSGLMRARLEGSDLFAAGRGAFRLQRSEISLLRIGQLAASRWVPQ